MRVFNVETMHIRVSDRNLLEEKPLDILDPWFIYKMDDKEKKPERLSCYLKKKEKRNLFIILSATQLPAN